MLQIKYLNDNYYDELDRLFIEIETSINCKISAANKAVDTINEITEDMLNWLRNFLFENVESEIYFFKHQKPRVISKLIFYSQLIEIEANLPSSKAAVKKYYLKKIQYYNLLIQKNAGFFQYFRAKLNKYDELFFVRKIETKKIYLYNDYMLHYDNLINTKHDFSMVQIMAYDLLINYLENLLENKNQQTNIKQTNEKPALKWTGNKIELIELVYALQNSNSINHGKSDIKELAKIIGQMLGIEIEEGIYRNFLDIKNRKTEKTKFLNTLSQNLSDFIEKGEN